MRIRSKWRASGKDPTLADNATALAYAIWQIALNAAKGLHSEKFDYQSDEQRIEIISEYIVFLVHIADRLSYENMAYDSRSQFITTLAQEAAKHLQRNCAEILGSGDYRIAFIERLNESSEEYSGASFSEGKPGYDLLRCFGHRIFNITGSERINDWVLGYIIEIDAPNAIGHLKKAIHDLFKSIENTGGNISGV